MDPRYAAAFRDWLACAVAGRRERAAQAAASLGADPLARIVALGTAGHVLDYDDTFLPGIAHLSAPNAPVALVMGAERGCTVGEVVDAYAHGFEVAGAASRAGYPHLYDQGWHPTAVCGALGAAATACRLLGIPEREPEAIRLAALQSSGLRAAFGSDGKALQVGFAAAAGARSARLVAAGARSPATRALQQAVVSAYGAPVLNGKVTTPAAIDENWIKVYPCCLQTHGAIEAAAGLRERGASPGPAEVTVHPLSRQAASYDDVSNGLEAKFSIPYTVAYTLLHGPPSVEAFTGVDEAAAGLAKEIRVLTDSSLLESEAVVSCGGATVRIGAAKGSPQRPASERDLADKARMLAGEGGVTALADASEPIREVLRRLRLL